MSCRRPGHPTQLKPMAMMLAVLLAGAVVGQAQTVAPAGTSASPSINSPYTAAATGTGTTAPAPESAEQKLRKGDYAGAAALATKTIQDTYASEDMERVLAEALMAQGRYDDAYATLRQSLQNNPRNARLLLLFRQACLYAGKTDEAQQTLDTLKSVVQALDDELQAPTRITPPDILAAGGEAALLLGHDPKQVLQQYLTPAEQATSPDREAFLAAGRLGLDHHDYQLASTSFGKGMEKFPDDADLLSGMAAAFQSSDRDKFAHYAEEALAANPQHVPTMLMLADNLIDAEAFDKAREVLQKILAINPHEQSALALESVIAYLHNQSEQGDAYRAQALTTWAKNPRIDYLIGQKLSQNYRFELGAKFQGKALEADPQFSPARVQLAQDLLRLGREDEGWKLAEQVHSEDGYDVEAFNLVSLHDEIANYTVINQDGFQLCMEPTEAKIYGSRLLNLLKQARDTVAKKYGVEVPNPVLVEVFPNAADFSVRTFGMPDIGEFLGVTFGPVVTLNSPSTHDANWEDVTWHEFTHVVTLTMTHNQMPRWLSEGISVYEERQARPNWGDPMSLDDCQRILGGKMEPLSMMSAAFLNAKSMEDTQFAYFESMLVVQYLIEKYGFDHLQALLKALGRGDGMNDALAANFAPVSQLDDEFAQYAKDQAQQFCKGWTLAKPEPSAVADLSAPAMAAPSLVAAVDPHDFYARMDQIESWMGQEEWAKARDAIKQVNDTGLYLPGEQNLYLMLADACGKLNDTAGEKAALLTVAEHEGDAVPAVTRLLEIAREEKDWPSIERWSQATLAIHPLSAVGWRGVFDASEEQKNYATGIAAGQALVELQQPDLASLHYRIAKMMQAGNDLAGAHRQALQALEEAPRYRAAYELLNTLSSAPAAPASPATTSKPAAQ